MGQQVIIKANTNGLSVYLDPDIPFDELLDMVYIKFSESAKFFKGATMAATFEGRHLSNEQTDLLTNAICSASGVDIACVIDKDPEREAMYARYLDAPRPSVYKDPDPQPTSGSCAPFYKGTLRSGQSLESDGNIVILGDVNPGARISAAGNIVVLGALRGEAYAGCMGACEAVVIALEMTPITLTIGDYTYHPRKKTDDDKKTMKIAYVRDDDIKVKALNKESIDEIGQQ